MECLSRHVAQRPSPRFSAGATNEVSAASLALEPSLDPGVKPGLKPPLGPGVKTGLKPSLGPFGTCPKGRATGCLSRHIAQRPSPRFSAGATSEVSAASLALKPPLGPGVKPGLKPSLGPFGTCPKGRATGCLSKHIAQRPSPRFSAGALETDRQTHDPRHDRCRDGDREWAVADSNRRPPVCETGALTN